MDGEFLDALREVLHERLDETIEFGRTWSVNRLAGYLKALFGEALYTDSLIALLQQYALADVPLLAPTGRSTGTTGFHLALFGPPGTGKTFSIDDMVRGNPRSAVPPHGLPGRNRYCGGITPVQFLRVGASYTGRTFNFIVPEFNDWFKYRGMVEPLKLVMEQREVKWETTLGTVGPYTFRSFFSVNYNVRTAGASDYWTTIADPNFAALEDRMLLRFHPMTRDRFRAVEASAERLELGELEFDLAGKIRDHLVLVHAIETRHPLVAGRFPSKPVTLDPKLYQRLREVSEAALKTTEHPKFSPRLKSRAVRLAAAASLLSYFAHPNERALPIAKEEGEFARRFYQEEIRARQGRRGGASSAGVPGSADLRRRRWRRRRSSSCDGGVGPPRTRPSWPGPWPRDSATSCPRQPWAGVVSAGSFSRPRGSGSTSTYAERGPGAIPRLCPVCGSGLEPIRNSTLDGPRVELGARCRSCGYWTHLKRRVPVRYSFRAVSTTRAGRPESVSARRSP